MGRARVPSFSRVVTSFRFSSRKTRRAMCKVLASAQGVRVDSSRVLPRLPRLTCNADAVNVLGNNAFPLNDPVELGSATMQDDGVESDTVQEADAEGQLIQLVENGTSDFYDGELGGLRHIGG